MKTDIKYIFGDKKNLGIPYSLLSTFKLNGLQIDYYLNQLGRHSHKGGGHGLN